MPNKYLFLLDIEKEGHDGVSLHDAHHSVHAFNEQHAHHVLRWLMAVGAIDMVDGGTPNKSSLVITPLGSGMLRAMERIGKTGDDDE